MSATIFTPHQRPLRGEEAGVDIKERRSIAMSIIKVRYLVSVLGVRLRVVEAASTTTGDFDG